MWAGRTLQISAKPRRPPCGTPGKAIAPPEPRPDSCLAASCSDVPGGTYFPPGNCIPRPLQEHPGPTASTLGPTGRVPGIVLSTLGTASCAALQTPRSRDCHYPLEMRELRLRVAMELAHRSTPLERGDLNPGIVASTPARFTAALDWLFRAATLQNLCTSTPVPRAFTRRATDIAEHPRSLRLCPRPG